MEKAETRAGEGCGSAKSVRAVPRQKQGGLAVAMERLLVNNRQRDLLAVASGSPKTLRDVLLRIVATEDFLLLEERRPMGGHVVIENAGGSDEALIPVAEDPGVVFGIAAGERRIHG